MAASSETRPADQGIRPTEPRAGPQSVLLSASARQPFRVACGRRRPSRVRAGRRIGGKRKTDLSESSVSEPFLVRIRVVLSVSESFPARRASRSSAPRHGTGARNGRLGY